MLNEQVQKDFPNLDAVVHGKSLVYMDNAATTLKPRKVLDAVQEYYSKYSANIHRGVHQLSMIATDKYERTREICKNFINAESEKEIIFTSGTTGGLNMLALSLSLDYLKKGDEVILTAMEHHSNLVPWQMLRDRMGIVLKFAPMTESGTLDVAAYKELFSDKTKLVSMVHVSNSLGTINPVKELIEFANAKGCLTIIDAAQSIAHEPVDVQDLGCDFLVFSGHKIYGPTGTGVLWGKQGVLETLPPVFGGGDMILNVTLEKTTFNELPHRLEAGTPHIAGVIGLGAALEYVNEIGGISAIKTFEDELLSYGKEVLGEINGLRMIGTAEEKAAIFSFVLDGIHPHDIGTLLDEQALAVRTGHHCTQPVMTFFKIPATTRASLAIYNSKEDINKLAHGIKKVQEVFAKCL